jgi:PAS domain S-box-containing protein
MDGKSMVSRSWRSVAAAILAAGVGLAVRAAFLEPLGTRAPWITFFPAVILAALATGFPGGLLATVLSCVAVAWVWPALGHPPFLVAGSDWLLMAVFFGIGVLVSSVTEAMRRARDRDRAGKGALLKRERELRGFLDAIPNPVFLKDRESRWLLANRAALALLGRSADEVIGKADHEFLGDEAAAAALRRNDVKVMDSGVTEVVEESVPTSAGLRVYQSTRVPFRDAEGRVVGIIGSAVDVTERKRTEEVLAFLAQSIQSRSGERFFQDLAGFLARLLDMQFICIDRLEGDGLTAQTLAVWCDGAFQDNVSYALKDTPCGDVVGKEVCCFPASVCQYFPRDLVLQDLRAESYVGVTLWSHSGAPIGLIAVIGRSPLADPGVAAGVLKMVASRASNELERLETERELAESERRYRLVVTTMAEGLLLQGPDGTPTACNPAAERILGMGVEEMRALRSGAPFGDAVREDRSPFPAGEQPPAAALRTGRRQPGVVMGIRGPAGGLGWISVNSEPVLGAAGGVDLVVSTFTDITAAKEAEAEHTAIQARLVNSARLAALGTLVAGLAHEINNPLAAEIAGAGVALELTREARERFQAGARLDTEAELRALDQVTEALTDAQEGGQRIARIVKDMAAFARPEAGRTRIRLGDVVNDAIRWVPAPLLQASKVEVVDLGPPEVMASAGQIQQVVVNLLTNAVKARPPGAPGKVVLRIGPGDSGQAFLEVTDDGAGIAPAIRDRIFEPFFTTRPVGEGRGTGLGLAVSHAIAASHGGTLTVESEVGKGSTFRVELPAAPVEA